jgi:acetoin utilization protein AcuB
MKPLIYPESYAVVGGKRHKMQVQGWMTLDPIMVGPHVTLGEAYDLMMESGIRRLPVVDNNGDLVGIVTRSDILQYHPAILKARMLDEDEPEEDPIESPANVPVREVMTWEPITVAPDDTIRRAAERLLEYQISGLPVVEGEHVVGIITESDLFRVLVAYG